MFDRYPIHEFISGLGMCPRRYLRAFKLLPRLYGNARISSRLTGHLRSAPENGSLVQ